MVQACADEKENRIRLNNKNTDVFFILLNLRFDNLFQ